MFIVAALGILVSMALALARAFVGPTLYDRVLAGNSFGTKTVLLLGVMGFLMGRPDFLDIALIYALINFTGTVAVLKFFRYRTLSVAIDGEQTAGPEFATGFSGQPGQSQPNAGQSAKGSKA